jgi:hypothetical protein
VWRDALANSRSTNHKEQQAYLCRELVPALSLSGQTDVERHSSPSLTASVVTTDTPQELSR